MKLRHHLCLQMCCYNGGKCVVDKLIRNCEDKGKGKSRVMDIVVVVVVMVVMAFL